MNEVASTQLILFAELRNPTVFENYPGVIPVYMQRYIFSRTCLSTDDLKNLIAALAQCNLELVYVSPTLQIVGIRGSIADFQAMNLYELGQISASGGALTSTMTTGQAGQSQSTTFWQRGAIGTGLVVGGAATAKTGLTWISMNAGSEGGGGCAKSSLRRHSWRSR